MNCLDDGVGIPADALNQLKQQLDAHKRCTDSIGIANVSARLKLQYGQGCVFDISSEPGDGTSIFIQIPACGQ